MPRTTSPVDDDVVALMRREEWPLKPTEIAKWLDIPSDQARRSLTRLRKKGVVSRNDNGYWQLVDQRPKENQ